LFYTAIAVDRRRDLPAAAMPRYREHRRRVQFAPGSIS